MVDIAPFNSVDRVHQINLLQLPLATQNLFDHIAPGAVPQIESFYAKNRFEFYSALQNTTAVHVSLEEAKAIAKKHEVNDKGSTKLIIEKVNRKLQNSKEY